jgi:hypothetical protein
MSRSRDLQLLLQLNLYRLKAAAPSPTPKQIARKKNTNKTLVVKPDVNVSKLLNLSRSGWSLTTTALNTNFIMSGPKMKSCYSSMNAGLKSESHR